jgi:hypothetical protein
LGPVFFLLASASVGAFSIYGPLWAHMEIFMVDAVPEGLPASAARHILSRLNVRPDPQPGKLSERLAGLARGRGDVNNTCELAMSPSDGDDHGRLQRKRRSAPTLHWPALHQAVHPGAVSEQALPQSAHRNFNRWLCEVARDVMLR